MRAFVLSSLVAAVAVVGGCSNPAPAASQEATVAAAAHLDEGKGESCEADKGGEHAEEQHETAKPDREQVDADGVVRRGAKVTDGAALTVADAVA